MLNILAQQGLFYGYTTDGEFVTVQELLEREFGREFTYDEAVKYIQKAQFIAGIRRHSKFHSETTA